LRPAIAHDLDAWLFSCFTPLKKRGRAVGAVEFRRKKKRSARRAKKPLSPWTVVAASLKGL
jgi:hypothetical protein